MFTLHFIQVKNILFIRSILILDNQALSKQIFCDRAKVYYRNPITYNFDHDYSVVFDLLRVASLFNLSEEVLKKAGPLLLQKQLERESMGKGMGP